MYCVLSPRCGLFHHIYLFCEVRIISPVVQEVQEREALFWRPPGRQNMSSACPGSSEQHLLYNTHAEVFRLLSGFQPAGPFILLPEASLHPWEVGTLGFTPSEAQIRPTMSSGIVRPQSWPLLPTCARV